ncbi:MAG: PBP1A family penicillin-binding protein [Succinatimonas sp.]|nr:PBP1A family penicillin-binding protein [Succinatimonas sp.]
MFLRLQIVRTAIWAGLFLGAISTATGAGLYYSALGSLPDVSELRNVSFETPMQVFTKDGKLIGEFGEAKRIPVPLDQIPLKLRQAFLAIEDSRFYEHSGVDPIGILRAAAVAVANSGHATQGASTITQQVARNFFLTREKTLKRKIKEVFISLRIEQVLTKDEIFELYLNKIALGHNAYGVAAAAQVYYGKELKDLTLAQMATIAGLPKAPSTLNPISNPERSRDRRNTVLGRMLSLGYITKAEFDEASSAPYKTFLHGAPLEAYAPYVAENARQFVLDKFGEQAYTDGFKIYTSIDSKTQLDAHYAVFKGVTAYDKRHGYRGVAAKTSQIQDFTNNDDGRERLLRSYDRYHFIVPALVNSVNDKDRSATLMLRHQKTAVLSWEGMKWAAPFRSDRSQGAAPRKPSDIMQAGDVIYVYNDEKGLLTLTQLPEVESSLVALNPYDGGIEALVGGYDFEKSKFDRTTMAKRQVGSNFKPFLYSAAVAKGISINSLFMDEPLRTWDPGSRTWWEPKNTPNRYDGIMTLREALARSKNVVSVRLIRQIGVPNAVTHVQKFGFEISKSQQVESMALGSVEVTPLELVTGYAVFANGGYKLSPYLITKISRNGETVYENTPKKADPAAPDRVINDIDLKYDENILQDPSLCDQVLSHGNAFIVADMMRSVIYGGEGMTGPYWGTGGRASATTGRKDLHGKTGTTNDVHDAWFSGFNSHIVATAWMGFDTDRDLGHSAAGPEGGAYSALPVWAEFIKRSQNGKTQDPLPKPAEVSQCMNEGISDYCLTGSQAISEAVPQENGEDDNQSSSQSPVSQNDEESTEDIF